MTDLLDLVTLNSGTSWLLLVGTLMLIFAVPRLFGLRLLTALVYAQITLAFNAVTIIAGFDTGALDIGRALHFYANEFGFLVLTFAAYRHLLRHRLRVTAALEAFFAGRAAPWLTVFVAAIGVFNFIVVPTDGESRIGYMTEAWFSLLKPFIQLGTPLAYVGVLFMLRNPTRRRLGFILLLVTIASNVLTGSKASFVFSLLTAILALRDLSGAKSFVLRRGDRLKMGLLVIPLVVLTLTRLEVSPQDVFDRFMLFGEATILTYFSDTPTAACKDLSTLASMHRGVARALGDESARDIDTLFGFALTRLQLGENTLTGPNGRLSAYFLCNFPAQSLVLGWFMVGLYFGSLLWLYRRVRRRPLWLAAVYPYIITSFGLASQDFNLIMADVTLATLLLLATLVPSLRPKRYSLV